MNTLNRGYIGILDFETTGLSPKEDRVISYGLLIVERKSFRLVDTKGSLVYPLGPFSISPEITELTGITKDDVVTFGESTYKAFDQLSENCKYLDCVIAHNGTNFDKLFYEEELLKLENLQAGIVPNTINHWVDSSVDVVYSPKIQTRKLTYLCAEHGFANPFPHKAVTDCLALYQVLKNYDFEEIFKRSLEKNITIKALVEKPWLDSGESKEKAKALGFRWDGEKQHWTKTIKEGELSKEVEKLGYQPEVL